MIHEQQKIISDNTKKIEKCENYTEQMEQQWKSYTQKLEFIEKDITLNSFSQKCNYLERNIIHTIEDNQIAIDLLPLKFQVHFESSTNKSILTSFLNGPQCNLCKKNIVTEKFNSNKKWKTRCTSCLSKSRIFAGNTKRKRTQ
jgi:hypothetical protein